MSANKRIIGVTGITGSGTSTVATILAAHGGFVISADRLAHEVMQKGKAAYDEILRHFGSRILDENNEIDRKKLGVMVFSRPEKLKLLEGIIHPQVIAKTQELLMQADGAPFAVIDAPLLIEAGMHKICSEVWLVTAIDDVRLARIMARDGINEETALRRLHSRAGDDHLRQFADIVIENNAGVEALHFLVKANCVRLLTSTERTH